MYQVRQRCYLRGGSEAIHSNTALANILSETAEREGIPGAVQFVDITDRQAVHEMIALPDLIDLIVPRGSYELVRYLMKQSEIPVLGHADGICHVYVDQAANTEMAEEDLYQRKERLQGRCVQRDGNAASARRNRAEFSPVNVWKIRRRRELSCVVVRNAGDMSGSPIPPPRKIGERNTSITSYQSGLSQISTLRWSISKPTAHITRIRL